MAVRFAALASLGASIVHFAVVPAHWHEWAPAGVFFVSVALFQLAWSAVVLVRTSTSMLAAGILLNVGTIALWALSRTAGAPIGPHAGQAEVVAGADLCALLLQVYVVMGAGWVYYRGLRGAPVPAFASAAILLGAAGVIALASTVGTASGLRHSDHAPAGSEPGHHVSPADHADDHHSLDPEPSTSPPAVRPVEAPAPVSVPLPAAEPLNHEDHGHVH